jgi:hypothetical protein
MRSRTPRRTLAALALVALASALAWVGAQASRTGPLPASASLPLLAYHDGTGRHVVRPEGAHRTMIMLFNSKCGHCAYELDAFERRSAELAGARVYFLTTEAAVPMREVTQRWPTLTRPDVAQWGTVNADELRDGLRTAVTPAVFVFDERGRLLGQFRGETKLDVVLSVLASHATS